ncbi:PTS sugar transporter subunit IIA [Yersinia ruckeri]|uniref:PTS sugar transporter subunit IIA n=1 Tax=Yersinia ruckeri TaxID=29486 RepID=UPI0020BDDBC9|nr:PTS sugar transporter subunit IIA [Yersinia ruckeri]ELM3740873.1 PTS sugar transporter subunit IIA [Yersinia ruckeri]MCK8543260.1 PTS sugar transporter subunit IIA [Yersinia ruckeri]MCK8552705.1 PTS sugar transporter subunit IIA [Yersinia ruckeri]MCW6519865.1 PTS sugar transporter subunit IIA [Yersinia ruckeri]MCW6550889.1 PTS sugar transporter subunit IIA [Yersinia ruckeri]
MLKKLLTADVVQVVEQAKDWRDAIAISCKPLIDNGAIEPRYVEAIYRSHEAIGPYYVVGPGIAMPHARPEEGVNRLSLALTVISSGVSFNAEENDPVKLLIVLAATDNNSHIEAISQLAQLFDNENDVNSILNAKTTQDILSVIARY